MRFHHFVLALFVMIQWAQAQAASMQITAGIPPVQYLAERIGGDLIQVQSLVEPGQSPHTYEPTPRQMTALAQSKLYLKIGIPFEDTIVQRFASSFKNVKVVDLRQGIELIPSSDPDEVGQNGRANPDPHIWLDPQNAMLIAKGICQALSAADPSNPSAYQNNLAAVLAELTTLNQTIAQQLHPYQNRAFYVFHPDLGYFAKRYGLKQRAIEHEGKEPSPKQLSELVDAARKDKVQAILTQPQYSPQAAQAMASAIGGSVMQVNPLEKDYFKSLHTIADAIDKALSPNAAGH